jgi:hypothetical protein
LISDTMNAGTDSRIDAFRQTLERADMLRAQLDTLSIELAHRDELPGMIADCVYAPHAAWLREELAASVHPLSIRIRHVQVERELREVLAGAGAAMRAALDAAAQLVTAAAGGSDAVMTFPFARSHLRELARYHSGPSAPVTRESWLAHLRVAWRDIDAAVAAVQEIQFDARHRTSTS